LIDILVPHYNYPAGIRLIEQELKLKEKKFNLIVSDDSDQNKIETTGRLLKGPQKGAVNNWNFLLDISKNDKFILVHQDERIVPRDMSALDTLSSNIVYVCDLTLNVNCREIFLSGRVRAWIMNTFPNLIFYLNFIGPTATLIIPTNNLRFNTDLKWLVDVEYYAKLREHYKFKYSPSIHVISDTTIGSSITNSGDIGITEEIEEKELSQLLKKRSKFLTFCFKAIWHLYRLKNTRST